MRGDKRTPVRPDKKGVFRPQGKGPERGSGKGPSSSASMDALLGEAISHMEAGKYSRAAASIKQILNREPEHADALRLSATLQLKLGSRVGARAAFESLARKAIGSQDFRGAESLLREYLEVGPRCVPFLEMLGEVLERLGDTPSAVSEYEKAITILLEDEDPDRSTKGPELYGRIKHLEPHGAATQRLASYFGVTPPLGTDGSTVDIAPSQLPSAPPTPGESRPGIAPSGPGGLRLAGSAAPNQAPQTSETEGAGAGTARPWEDQTVPAPFPWEVGNGAETETPSSLSPLSDTSGGEQPQMAPAAGVFDSPAIEQPATPPGAPAVTESPWEQAPEEVPEAGLSSLPPMEPVPSSMEDDSRGLPAEAFTSVDGQVLGDAETDSAGTEALLEPPIIPIPPEPPAHVEPPGFISPPDAPNITARSPARPAAPARPEKVEKRPSREPVRPPGLTFLSEPEPDGEPFEEPSQLTAAPDWQEPQAEQAPAPFAGLEITLPPDEDTTAEPSFADGVATPAWGEPSTGKSSKKSRSAQKRKSTALFPTAWKLRQQATQVSRNAISTVRSFVMLCVGLVSASVGVGVLGIVGLSLTWVGLEESPDTAFHNLSSVPARTVRPSQTNGYVVLRELGEVSSGEPVAVGRGRVIPPRSSESRSAWPEGFADVAQTAASWYATWDSVAGFRRDRGKISRWSQSYRAALRKYQEWIGKGFDDTGYGSLDGPDEPYVLALHRLYVAEGFAGGTRRGVARLRADMESWRRAFSMARTLRVKVMAAEAMKDDLTVVSALLSRPALSKDLIPTLSRMSRPLGNNERSLRWPMQSQFALEKQALKAHIDGEASAGWSFHRRALTFFPLPEQKVLNGHAKYYEALAKHDAGLSLEQNPRLGMPNLYSFAGTPARSFTDYISNPIDNVLIQSAWTNWGAALGRVIEVESRLRLASLQVRLRKKSLERDPFARIAKAGHGYFDPFTGFPMLFNPSKTLLYSVGMNGSDEDGNFDDDVSVPAYMPRGR